MTASPNAAAKNALAYRLAKSRTIGYYNAIADINIFLAEGQTLAEIEAFVVADEAAYALDRARRSAAAVAPADAERALQVYRDARYRERVACERADRAFARWFGKLQEGAPTNAAAAQRLANLANYASTDTYVAESKLYRLGLDPREVDRADHEEGVW